MKEILMPRILVVPVTKRYKTNMSREWSLKSLSTSSRSKEKEEVSRASSSSSSFSFFLAQNMRARVYHETHFLLSQVKAHRAGENVFHRDFLGRLLRDREFD